MVSFEEFQQQKNRKYYTTRGTDFLKDFKTFAADKYFVTAIAQDFYSRVTSRGTINVYEMGVGTGTLFISFMIMLRKLDPDFTERVVYHVCDISEGLVKNAVRRGDAFGFNVDGIVYDGLPKFVKDADYVLSNELYSDLPAKMLMNDGKQVLELHIEDKKRIFKPFKNGAIEKYMKTMPEGYLIPVNVVARENIEMCVGGLNLRGCLDIFDYGFDSSARITEIYPDLWNNAIYRDYGGQVTTDLNFDFLSRGLKAKIEAQKTYVENVLKKCLEEDIDSMRYRECKLKTEKIQEEGDFYHMRLRK